MVESKVEAIVAGRAIARSDNVELFVHGLEGRIHMHDRPEVDPNQPRT